jgi:HAD superfamily hydrolase (TIGR01509 family)
MVGLNVPACKDLLRVRFGPDFPVDQLEASAGAIYFDLIETHGAPVKPGLAELIRFLDDRRIPKAVATSTATGLALHKLSRAGVLNHFEVVVGGDQVARGKPHPEIYLLAASRISQRPGDCVVLEDSEPGVLAAAAAGMKPILIPDMRPPSDRSRAAAFAVVPSLSEAVPVIRQMLQLRSA